MRSHYKKLSWREDTGEYNLQETRGIKIFLANKYNSGKFLFIYSQILKY